MAQVGLLMTCREVVRLNFHSTGAVFIWLVQEDSTWLGYVALMPPPLLVAGPVK